MSTPGFLPHNPLMPHTLKVYKRTGLNTYGEPEYSTTPETYRCYVTSSKQYGRSSEVDQDVVQYVAYVDSDGQTISTEDRVVLQEEGERPVSSVQKHYDHKGRIDSVTVYFS